MKLPITIFNVVIHTGIEYFAMCLTVRCHPNEIKLV